MKNLIKGHELKIMSKTFLNHSFVVLFYNAMLCYLGWQDFKFCFIKSEGRGSEGNREKDVFSKYEPKANENVFDWIMNLRDEGQSKLSFSLTISLAILVFLLTGLILLSKGQ